MQMREMVTKDVPARSAQLNTAKLERMQQFAEAASCRRKILLNYFCETLGDDCGNCDICRNPPTTFDGTLIAQKALSAVFRSRERVAINLLIDILRGMRNQAVLHGGYDQIKTYGAGRDLPYLDWYSYMHQMLNDGLFYIAYEEGYALKITERGQQVLKGQLQLAAQAIPARRKSRESHPRRPKAAAASRHHRHARSAAVRASSASCASALPTSRACRPTWCFPMPRCRKWPPSGP